MPQKKNVSIFDDNGLLIGAKGHYVEQDLSQIDEIVVRFHAYDLLRMYGNNDPLLTERIAEYGAPALREMVKLLQDDAKSSDKKKGGHEKYLRSDYPALKAQVLAFFRDEAHKVSEVTGKPIYRSRNAFVEAAIRHCNAHPINGAETKIPEPPAVHQWLIKNVTHLFPTHWRKNRKQESD